MDLPLLTWTVIMQMRLYGAFRHLGLSPIKKEESTQGGVYSVHLHDRVIRDFGMDAHLVKIGDLYHILLETRLPTLTGSMMHIQESPGEISVCILNRRKQRMMSYVASLPNSWYMHIHSAGDVVDYISLRSESRMIPQPGGLERPGADAEIMEILPSAVKYLETLHT